MRRPSRKKKYCRQKVRYRNENDARMAMAIITQKSNRSKIPDRVYWCSRCNGWHLTSQTKEMFEF